MHAYPPPQQEAGENSGLAARKYEDEMVAVNVRLSGRWGLRAIESELSRGPVELDLPDDVTPQALLQSLVGRYGPPFGRKALKANGALRAEVRLFIEDREVEDLSAPIGAELSRGAEVSIVLLAPLIGG